MLFELTGVQSYFSRMMTRFCMAVGLSPMALITALWAAGALDTPMAAFAGLAMAVSASGWTWRIRSSAQGDVELEAEGFVLRRRMMGSLTCPWADVGGIRLARATEILDPGSLLMARMTRVDLDEPVVEVTLRRSLRLNPVTEGTGARGFGFPVGLKRLLLSLKEPEAFVEAARMRLASAGVDSR